MKAIFASCRESPSPAARIKLRLCVLRYEQLLRRFRFDRRESVRMGHVISIQCFRHTERLPRSWDLYESNLTCHIALSLEAAFPFDSHSQISPSGSLPDDKDAASMEQYPGLVIRIGTSPFEVVVSGNFYQFGKG